MRLLKQTIAEEPISSENKIKGRIFEKSQGMTRGITKCMGIFWKKTQFNYTMVNVFHLRCRNKSCMLSALTSILGY